MKYWLFFWCGDAFPRLDTQNCREKLIFKVAYTRLELRSPMFGELCLSFFFFVKFNRIDKIAGGFPSQVDFQKLSNIMFKLSVLQKVPTWHSPNVFIYKLKCTKRANVVSTLWKWGLTRPSKIMVPWKLWSSKYVVFPERQPYFTYGDLHSSGKKNYAFQLTILQCKICRYSDCLKMCL